MVYKFCQMSVFGRGRGPRSGPEIFWIELLGDSEPLLSFAVGIILLFGIRII